MPKPVETSTVAVLLYTRRKAASHRPDDCRVTAYEHNWPWACHPEMDLRHAVDADVHVKSARSIEHQRERVIIEDMDGNIFSIPDSQVLLQYYYTPKGRK